MSRRHGGKRLALVLLGGLTALATTVTSGAPIALTEANWNDTVHVNANLTASQFAGQNYARSIGAYGTIERILTNTDMGELAASRVTGQTPIVHSNDNTYSGSSAGVLPVEVRGRRCARAQPIVAGGCITEDWFPTSTSFATAGLESFSIRSLSILGQDLITFSQSGTPEYFVRVSARCTPGEVGATDIINTSSKSFRLGNATAGTPVAIPTATNRLTSGENEISGLYHYSLKLSYENYEEKNHAWAQLSMRAETTNLLGGQAWSVNAILARAECGSSRPMPSMPSRPSPTNPAIPNGTAGRAVTMNAVMDEVLATEAVDAEAGTLDDAAAEARPTESENSPTTTATTTTGTPEEDGESATSSHSTSTASPTDSTTAEATETSETSTAGPTLTTQPPSTTSVAATVQTTIVQPSTPSSQPTPQPTTSTSTEAPEIVIPDEPGTLAAAAQVAEVDTITAGEVGLVVVVDGDTVPTDARAGARALETWLDGGTPSTTWATLTSDDPDQDGWRWAAINQRTGTVVYIR